MRININKKTLLNFSFLSISNAIGQIIPLLTTPILARLYSPENYGLVAYYSTLLITISAFAPITGSLGIFSTKSNKEAKQTIWANIYISAAFSIIIFLLISGFDIFSGYSLSSSKLSLWHYSLPLCVFLSLIVQIILNWYNRIGAFKKITTQRIFLSAGTVFFQVILAFFFNRSYGLVLGFILGLLFSTIPIIFSSNRSKETSIGVPLVKTFPKIVITNKNYLIFGYPSNLVNIIINQLPAWYFKANFAQAELGYLNMSKRLIEAPFSAIGGSINELYRNMLTDSYIKQKDLYKYMKQTLFIFLFVSIPFFLILYFTLESLINIYLGPNWSASILYSKYFLIFILFQFLSSPFSFIFVLKKKLQTSLIMNVFLFICISISLLFAYHKNFSSQNTILFFILVYSSFYIITLILSFKLAKTKVS